MGFGKKLKAQGVVLETVILFAIGVGIFIGFVVFFNNYNSYFSSLGEQLQLDAVKNIVVSDIVKVALKTGDATLVGRIEKNIGNEPYKISLNRTGLYLSISNYLSSSNIYNLNSTFSFADSSVWSTGGKVTIIKEGNNIKLVG